MSDKDQVIQDLVHEVARWKNRALEAAERACDECERGECGNCRIKKIKEEAVS